MERFDILGLTTLLQRTTGRPDIVVGLIDGPVALDHPDLAGQRIREIGGFVPAECADRGSAACAHGTFVAGILAAKRRSVAPAMCPDCTLLVRPIFSETTSLPGFGPTATAEQLSAAIVDSVRAGARVLNLSVNLTGFSSADEGRLADALNFAASRGAIPVVAAANQGNSDASTLTRHPWVLPVMAIDRVGRPLPSSTLSAAVRKHGVAVPGDGVVSLGTDGRSLMLSGTSAATALVTGTIALLWSELPKARAADVRFAISNSAPKRRGGLVPPMLNAWSTYQTLAGMLHVQN
ncbi:MAG: S8 family serine peptidase [Chloroflexi bacterium]|nr:S8 family serine peptidase [Chloroflexota bacterium]